MSSVRIRAGIIASQKKRAGWRAGESIVSRILLPVRYDVPAEPGNFRIGYAGKKEPEAPVCFELII